MNTVGQREPCSAGDAERPEQCVPTPERGNEKIMRYNRRQILRRAAAAGGLLAAPCFIPASVLGQQGAVAPSNRITLGSIGVGMMGQGHLRCCLGYPEARVLAVCEVDQWRRDRAKAAVEQAYAAGQAGGTYRGCNAYRDLRELLARDDIDAVVIATGDNWHGLATVLAAKAGKDFYCEKPISKTIREARAMAEAARRYGRVGQIGLQQRSTPEFIKACKLVREGRIGKVKMVYVIFAGTSSEVSLPVEPVPEGLDWDQWLGPAPVVPWHFCRDFGGGNLTSNTVHAFDTVQWGLGMDESGPVEVIPPETGEVPSLTYKYANGILLQVVNGKLDPQRHFVPEGWDPNTRIQNFGAVFVGEEGWIHVGRQGYLQSFPKEIVEQPGGAADLPRPVANHHQNWLECIKTRKQPACDVSVGCRSTIVSHLGCIAHWTGRALRWDPVKEEFPGDGEANRLRFRAMRDPWRI